MSGQTRASVPTLWGCFCLKRAFLRCKETPSLMQRDALLNSRRASLHLQLYDSR
ncbi:hypothetical protein HMPREF0973_01491 [Prevotella veroralis F0319]|uniref:Uncharacterized protein n=1 Tax=Prevotella veroralis F0319 TaxID=649761 RepID=C9MPF0_9BACT|nr:hypothetical protein HMPREF0973_01491 [Prevotella veroralis F0319]